MAIEAARVRLMYSETRKKDVEVGRLYGDDGFLLLDTDPHYWIESANPADRLYVLSLELVGYGGKNIDIDRFSMLNNLQRLVLCGCYGLEELPENLGDLGSLTCLSIVCCGKIKWLPNSIGKLSNLTALKIDYCKSLEKLPATLGDLGSLNDLSIINCNRIKWLPNSIGKLSNLTALTIDNCESLEELPATLGDLGSLNVLSIGGCGRIKWFPNSIYLFDSLEKLLATLGELPNLSVLNIEFTNIKWLPWSIAKLSKLSVLFLPFDFRLQTLPSHLNDSLVISVDKIHTRKTWAELKTEIQLWSIPVVTAEAAHFPSTPAYLQYEGYPRPWIQKNNLYSLVRILDLDLQESYVCADSISEFSGDLPMLTHLYISGGCLFHLPVTLTKITHLSLDECWLECPCRIETCFESLAKLSTLQSLELLRCDEDLPAHMDLPVSLTHITLMRGDTCDWLPDIYVSSINKLPNLKSLALIDYKKVDLSLLNVNLVKLKLWDCSIINSLPNKGLRHLEIMHSKDLCKDNCHFHDERKLWLYYLCPLVNLETLSHFSVTCRKIQSLPSIEGLVNLQELHLKDCFNLKKLPQNMDKLVNLRSINASCTRIKSLPDSFTNLQNLQRLILPKCFAFKSLSHNFQKKVTIIEDNTDDCYYKKEGYYDSWYDSSENSELTSSSIEEEDEVDLQSEREIFNQQASLDRPVNSTPNATQMHEDEHHIPNSICKVDTNANGLEVSENNPHVQRTVMFPSSAANANSSLQETTLNESNNVQAFPNRETDDMEIEQRIASANSSENPIHDRSDKRKKTHKIDIPRETLEELMSQGITTEEAAKKLEVSRPTVVRSLKEKGMSWPRPKKMKQHQDTSNVVQTSIPNAMRKTVEELSLESQCQVDGQQIEEHSNAAKECTSSNPDEQPDGSPSTFVVKATNKKNSVRFDFSLRSSIEQLKAEVGKRLELDVGKFKMKYLDEEKEWMVMADVTDLKHAWDLSKSSGSNVIRLSIVK